MPKNVVAAKVLFVFKGRLEKFRKEKSSQVYQPLKISF